MSLTTVSSASFLNIPRVFGLGRAASPPPSPPRTRTRTRKRQSPGSRPARTRDNRRAGRPRSASASTLSSLISNRPPPTPTNEPRTSWRESLRELDKQPKSNTNRVDKWRLGVADAVIAEAGNSADVATTAPTVGDSVRSSSVGESRATESHDLQSLSDEDIFALTQNIKNEEASRRPLVSPISPLWELRLEFSPTADTTDSGVSDYEGPSANVLRKIDWLRTHGGWQAIRRTRGDGDCFYRSLAFAYIEKIMTAPEPGLAVATSLSHLESTLPLLERAGFQKIVFEDFYEAFAELIQQVVPAPGKLPLTNESLLEQFQNPEISNSIVVFLRLLTSAYIRLSPEDDFTPFLIHPDTGEMVDVRTFVETFVEATGREADHPQIMALSRALRVRIEVAYLDNSSGKQLEDGTLPIDFVKFSPEGSDEDGTKPVVLLYRPGHYDTLEEKIDP
ncbi:unnamed protein product [Rhizoctonia solani]|uniref:ubiquitinyl hydrolase 1 n=2 Tax=Rhizoctonia solani TaxID=456999 RepID=A0A8H3A3A3_9AGAM|nr:unnamed protein product [Rhizoctonia solani]CAE6517303.1 unnamed protein product [Rhizoctonia solani]